MRLIHLREGLRYWTLLRREEHLRRHLFAVVFGDGGARGNDVSSLSPALQIANNDAPRFVAIPNNHGRASARLRS